MSFNPNAIAPSDSQREKSDPGPFRAVWAVTAAFGAYFCMYAFRKPFTSGTFADTTLWGIGFKAVLVVSQVGGYMVSKFIGIKVISEIPPNRRGVGILALIGVAEIALVGFGLVPRPWSAVCLFLNGLPLGMVFGLVLGSLEGRRITEALTAGLCASFILADGVTKSVGAWLLARGVTEDWMPAATGALFLLPLGLFVAMLAVVPPPSDRDVEHRSERSTMTAAERRAMFRRYAVGLVPLIVVYLIVTILRSVRADFAPELWKGLGNAAPPEIYSQSEIWVALGVLLINGTVVLIRDNKRAFFTALLTCGAGFILLGCVSYARPSGTLDGFAYMVLAGLGLYLPYVATHTTIFERLLAMTRDKGNIGYLMYVVDAFGYLGYVVVILIRNFGSVKVDMLGFFDWSCRAAVLLAIVCLPVCWFHFAKLAARGAETGAAKVESLQEVA